ncbi:MAG: hypothetical protein SGJ00_05550 [bacterium]|nr:hypothetical protein [bacterium]
MKTKIELDRDILNISNFILSEFPELSKYLNEGPVRGLSTGEISNSELEEYYKSLVYLVSKYDTSNKLVLAQKGPQKNVFPGYPIYPPSEDIYEQGKKEADLNPEDLSKKKTPNEKLGSPNEMGFENHMSGGDLDVPGSELDDQQESVGSEDEENDYYSLGGDDHNDLEEDRA